jgi:hypothetical protein
VEKLGGNNCGEIGEGDVEVARREGKGQRTGMLYNLALGIVEAADLLGVGMAPTPEPLVCAGTK